MPSAILVTVGVMTTGQAQGLSGVDADAHIGPAELTRHQAAARHLAGQPGRSLGGPDGVVVAASAGVTARTVPDSANGSGGDVRRDP